MIHYLEREWGRLVRVGPVRAQSWTRWGELICELGGTIHLNAEVDEILVNTSGKKSEVTGVRLKDGL